MRTRLIPAMGLALSIAATATSTADPLFVNELIVPGNATDLAPGTGANQNRLSLFSDLVYDRHANVYYGIPDRGPGGGVISFDTRVEKFTLDVDPTTGAVGNLKVIDTIFFTNEGGERFNGLNPELLNGNASVLGRSFDPEGLAVGANGHLFVADEYGPSVREFDASGKLVREFTPPDNLLPREGDGDLNFVSGRGNSATSIKTGRQDNRGFEGLTLSPDGTKLYAILQDPLVNEGTNGSPTPNGEGRRSRNLRIVEYDVATGASTKQFIYELESIDDINARLVSDPFAATAQGRNIGVSSITAINDHEFFVIERDNRGVGVEDADGSTPVGTKRVYRIDLTGATDVSGISLDGTNTLPGGVVPVGKVLYLDLQAALMGAGLSIPEKLEGLTIGPQLLDGSYAFLIGTDNDFSVTQTAGALQFDVCSDGTLVPLDGACPPGTTLLPSRLYAFKADVPGFEPLAPVPEPGTLLLIATGVLGVALRARRRES